MASGSSKLKENIKLKIVNAISRLNFGKIITRSFRHSLGLNKFKILCLQIHITKKCNMDCSYCYAKNHKGNPLKKERIFHLIDEAGENSINEIQLVGGEPFLHPKFKEILEYTLKKGFYIRIYTNGTLISKQWIKFLKKYPKKISLIFKFDSKDGYISHTSRDLYNKTVKKIEECTSNNIAVATFIAITKKNLNSIEMLMDKSFEIGAYPILERYIPACSPEVNKELEINNKEWYNVLELFKKYNKKYMIFYGLVKDVFGYYCSCYKSTLSIDTNGEALPCPYAPKELSLGNVNKIALSEIIARYKNKIDEWNKIPKECSSCKSSKECRGGCKTHVFLKNKRFGKKDSLCKEESPPTINQCSFYNDVVR